jgi:hypothetical protein
MSDNDDERKQRLNFINKNVVEPVIDVSLDTYDEQVGPKFNNQQCGLVSE